MKVNITVLQKLKLFKTSFEMKYFIQNFLTNKLKIWLLIVRSNLKNMKLRDNFY